MTLPFLSALATLLTVVPMSPSTNGGWTTYLKPYRYSDLLVRGDTVWCATREAGLLLYSRSGQRFSAITRAPRGLSGNELTSLSYDRSGDLWVGTNGGGLSRLSSDGSTWTLVNPFDGLPSDSVNCIRAEGDTVWVGTPSGIAFWNGSSIAGSLPIFGQPSPFASNNITGIVVHPDTVWVSTSAGIYASRRSTGLSTWVPLNNGLFSTNVQALVTNDTLMFCLANARGYVYVNGSWQVTAYTGNLRRLFDDGGIITGSTDQGIYRLCNNGWAVINTAEAGGAGNDETNTWIPAPDGAGRYVAACAAGLLDQPSPGAGSGWPLYTPDTPPDNDIRNLNLDGRVWVNSNEKGVGRYDGTQWRIWPSTPRTCTVGCDTTFVDPFFAWALLVDSQRKKWIACWEFALEEIDDSGPVPQFVHHTWPGAENDKTRMWSSTEDQFGGRWFGGDTPNLGVVPASGLLYFDASGTEIANYRGFPLKNDKIHALTVDSRGRLFIGYPGQGVQYTTLSAPGTGLGALGYMDDTNLLDIQGLIARGDSLWMLSTHSLLRYKLSNLVRQAEYNIPEATALFAGNPLAVGPDGSPWVGTEAGIRVFRPDGSSQDFNEANSPVAGNQIYAIRVDQTTGVVWIGTSSGMNRYDPAYRPPPPPQLPKLTFSVYPNPVALNKTGIQLRISGNGILYQGEIYDLRGRKVRHFDAALNHGVVWDGLDDDGQMVKPGIYFVHANAGGSSATVRVAVLR